MHINLFVKYNYPCELENNFVLYLWFFNINYSKTSNRWSDIPVQFLDYKKGHSFLLDIKFENLFKELVMGGWSVSWY